MTISRVEIKDFLVFKGAFAADFCVGINVFIGGNGTGKTTLMKAINRLCDGDKGTIDQYFFTAGVDDGLFEGLPFEYLKMETKDESQDARICIRFLRCDGKSGADKIYMNEGWNLYDPDTYVDDYTGTKSRINGIMQYELIFRTENYRGIPTVYIPEKDMLSNSMGLPETVEYGKAQFNKTEIDIIKKARVLADCPEQSLYREICSIIKGVPQNDGQLFFIKRPSFDKPIPFSMEASGYRKFGLLATLIRNEQIKPGSVLFWDEPENSLNPELVPKLVEILLKLSRQGVQVFIATHDYILAKYIDIMRNDNDEIRFHALYQAESHKVKCETESRFTFLENNNLTLENLNLYEAEVRRVME